MDLRKINKFWLLIAGFFLIVIIQEIRFSFQQAEILNTYTQMKIRLQDMQSTLESADKQNFVNAQKIPLPLTFCGDTLDMNNPFIRERVEREFYSLLGNQGQIQLYFKRTERYLPMIEMYLEAAELPDDLKFIAVHESALLPRIKSRSNAVGLWQFMYHTGRLYKLQIDRYIDERRNPEKATQAATRFLSDLYKKFESWPLVLAAYNSGQGRIQRSLKKQSSDEFITLSLPEETERYYFKIVATKIILSDPENFGFKFSGDDYFHVPALVEIEFKIKQSQMNLEKMAEDFGLDLIEFKEFNPQILANFLPAGLYTLKIPEDKYIAYQEKISSLPDKTSEEEANPSAEGESSEISWPAMQ